MRCWIALALLATLGAAEEFSRAAAGVRRLVAEQAPEARVVPVSPLMMRAALAPAGVEAVAKADRGFTGGFVVAGETDERKVAITVLVGRDEDAGVALYDAQVIATKAVDRLYGAMASHVARPTVYEPLSLDDAAGVVGLRVVEHLWDCDTEEALVLRSGRVVLAATITDGARGEAAWLARQVLELVRGAEAADPWDGRTGEEARRALVEALEAPAWGVRWRAARNLGRVEADAATERALERALRDPDATVRVAALRALAARGWLERASAEARAAVAADPDWMVRLAYHRLRELDTAEEELLAILDDPHPALRAFGFAMLQKRRNPGGGPVFGLGGGEETPIPWDRVRAGMMDPDSAVRLAALGAFNPWSDDVRPSEAQQALVGALQDANPQVRAKAADGLDRFMDCSPPVVDALVAALRDPSADVRGAAMDSLEEAGPSAAAGLPALTSILDDWRQREEAAELIGRIGVRNEAAVRKLEAGLATSDSDYRFEAARALWRVGSAPENFVDIVVETLREGGYRSDEAAQTLGQLGELARPYVPDLIHALASDNCWDDAARALGRLGAMAKDALPELVRLRDAQKSYVRSAANDAIQQIYIDLARAQREAK